MGSPSPNRNRICRLCWIKCESEHFEVVGKNTKDYMDMLLLNINVVIIREEPVICTNCEDKVKKCFAFKSMCLDIRDYIVPFVNDGRNAKLDLKDVCLSQRQNLCIPDDHDICAFCMGVVKSSCAIYLDIEGDNMWQKQMLEKCLPELDLTIIKEPIICALCHGSLKDYYLFLTNSLILGEKIKKYYEIHTTYSEADLFHALQSTLSNKPIDTMNEGKCSMNESRKYDDDDELVEVKNENFMEMGDHQQFDNVPLKPKDVMCCEEEDTKIDTIKTEGEFYKQQTEVAQRNEIFIKMEDQKNFLNEDIKIKTEQDFDSFQDDVESCSKVSIHKVPEHEILEKCDLTSYRGCHERHSLMHNKTSKHKCNMCKSNLKTHTLRRKDSSDIYQTLAVYQCRSCSYQSTFKGAIEMHITTHKVGRTSYRCHLCSFQASTKSYLVAHMVSHKNPFHLKYLGLR